MLPNWYVASEGQTALPRIIRSTADESLQFVGSFDSLEKTIRGDDDMYRPLTAEQRFKRNRVKRLTAENRILPTPLSVQPLVPKMKLVVTSNNWNIIYGHNLRNEANYLKGVVAPLFTVYQWKFVAQKSWPILFSV